jgi:hypothetical protein
MMMKLLDISGKIDLPTIAIYELLASTAANIGLDYVVVGATARDFMRSKTEHHGFTRGRMSPEAVYWWDESQSVIPLCVLFKISCSLGMQIPPQGPESWSMQLPPKGVAEVASKYAWC